MLRVHSEACESRVRLLQSRMRVRSMPAPPPGRVGARRLPPLPDNHHRSEPGAREGLKCETRNGGASEVRRESGKVHNDSTLPAIVGPRLPLDLVRPPSSGDGASGNVLRMPTLETLPLLLHPQALASPRLAGRLSTLLAKANRLDPFADFRNHNVRLCWMARSPARLVVAPNASAG